MMILKLMQTFASWQHKDNHKQTGNHIQNAISLKPTLKVETSTEDSLIFTTC